MPTIQPTRVSTPTVDGYITVCKGFNLFADGQAIDLAAEWNHTLADEEPVVALFKVHIKVGFGVYAGICGPAYAADIKLEGASDGAHIQLDASESEILAGFEMGFGLRLILTFDVWRMVIDAHWVSDGWNSHLQVDEYWSSVGRFGFDMTIDLLMLIARFLLTRGEAPIVTPARFPSGAGLAMIDSDLSGLATAGHASVEPKFMLMINVLDKFALGQALIEALQKVGATMMAGPTITLSAPTTVDVKKVATDGVEYVVTTANSVMSGSASGTSAVGASTLQLSLRHSSSIALSFGLGYTCTIAKIFSTSKYTPTIDLIGLLGITPHFGPFDHVIGAAYGASAPPARASRPVSGCCYQVVLDKPEPAAAM
jgi:hypothetical protein